MRKSRVFSFFQRLSKHRIGRRQIRLILLTFFCVAFILSAILLASHWAQIDREERALKELAALMEEHTPPSVALATTSPTPTTSIPTPREPVMLEQYRDLHEQNKDMVGWIGIDGSIIDYPVMFTADDFYLNHDFDKNNSKSGVPYIDKRCSVEPYSTNTIIYGHHMKNGTMFAGLEQYRDVDYYNEHPTIRFDTLYEQQEYEIIAVFESQIFKKSDTVFKHYNFLNGESESDFDQYIANIKALSLYDTGTTASHGDELLTLATCAYHTENGQFVVVARKK